MGAGASAQLTQMANQECQRPTDASDVNDVNAARQEVARLRQTIEMLRNQGLTPVQLDTTGDGVPNAKGYDTNGDGFVDSLDTTGNGLIDSKLIVQNGMQMAVPIAYYYQQQRAVQMQPQTAQVAQPIGMAPPPQQAKQPDATEEEEGEGGGGAGVAIAVGATVGVAAGIGAVALAQNPEAMAAIGGAAAGAGGAIAGAAGSVDMSGAADIASGAGGAVAGAAGGLGDAIGSVDLGGVAGAAGDAADAVGGVFSAIGGLFN